MEKTPRGTSVGVDDPYAFADVCDHLTSEGLCRYAIEHADHDPAFARERRAEDFRCPAADPEDDEEWRECPHFRSLASDRECARCGLEERRIAHTNERPLLEEHHLSYRDAVPTGRTAGDGSRRSDEDGEELAHEITIYLCRWCHAKVHTSWARITDDVSPDPEAIAAAEERRGRELRELDFQSAAERYSTGDE